MGIGVATTMSIAPPSISTAALLFLVLGDMSAAIIGVSFGGETCVVKLGRTGKARARRVGRHVFPLHRRLLVIPCMWSYVSILLWPPPRPSWS